MFMWRVARSTLPVGTNLLRRKITSTASCLQCGDEESELRLLFHCPFAREVWQKAPLQASLNVDSITDVKAGIAICNSLHKSPQPTTNTTVSAPWLLWSIWSSRNKKLFDNRNISEEETIQVAITAEDEWKKAQVFEPPTTPPLHQATTRNLNLKEVDHRKLAPETIICQTDTAWMEQSKNAGLGWVVLNIKCNVRARHCKPVSFVKGPSEAEALCIYEALLSLQNQQSSTIIVESDAKAVIMAINSRKPPLNLKGIIEDIISIAKLFQFLSFRFITRSENIIADDLAKKGIRSMTSCLSMSL